MASQAGVTLACAAWLVAISTFEASAQAPAPGEAWKTSPFHGVPNAATGQNIPCLCVYRGKQYRLGEAVCMQTHVGTVITRCDLNLNNTTWAPTNEPCNLSARNVPRFACLMPPPQSRPPV